MNGYDHGYAGLPPSDPASGKKKAAAMKKGLIPALAAGALGVALLLFGGGLFPSCASGQRESAVRDAAPPDVPDVDAYRASLEERIAGLVSEVAGAGDVTVMVTLDGGFRQVFAVEEKQTASGVSRTYVTVGSGASQSALFVTEEFPAVTGIGVVCTGGSDPLVRKEVTSLLSAVFSLGANKIYVTGR